MIVAVDAYYYQDKAKVVCIEFEYWTDSWYQRLHTIYLEGVAEYIPGEFYKKELPCILKILEQADLAKTEAIVIDGYVVLDDTGKIGLGGHLFHSLHGKVPVIGVAKTSYLQNTRKVHHLLRGSSSKPLYITSMGIDPGRAAEHIHSMHGEFRIPTLLKELDRVTKV